MKRQTPLVALLIVNAIACIGTRVSAIAIPWFVLVTTGSATQTGLVAACELAPYVIVKALAGPITDRLGQRRVSIVTDLASMIIIGLIPIAHLLGELSLPALLIMVAIGGGLRGPGDNAKHTTVPLVAEAVGAPLERVTGLYGAIERGSGLVAPAIAAIMINSVSAVGAIAVTAGCFGLSASDRLARAAPHPERRPAATRDRTLSDPTARRMVLPGQGSAAVHPGLHDHDHQSAGRRQDHRAAAGVGARRRSRRHQHQPVPDLHGRAAPWSARCWPAGSAPGCRAD